MKNLFNSSKKGQLTIFMILAIVIVISVGIIFYITQNATPEPEIGGSQGGRFSPELEDLPEEFRPIQNYVESCLFSVAEEGIRKMSNHGGYIDLLNEDYTLFEVECDPLNPTESDCVSLGFIDEDTILPYWYYLAGKNDCKDCTVSSIAPSLFFMELQLSLYVEKNIDSCINNFTELKEIGFDITNISTPIVQTRIHDEGEDFLLNYEFLAERNGVSQKITEYYIQSELPLKKLYDLAKDITDFESITNNIGSFTKNLISSQSGPSMNLLPPLFYQDDNKQKMFWLKPVVEQKMKNILLTYSQILQVKGTSNFDDSFVDKIPEEESMEKAFFVQAILPVINESEKNISDMSASLLYLGQSLYVEVWPHKGQKIMPNVYDPESPTTYMPQDISNDYKFFYDVSYPLVIELKNHDENNINNNLKFMFGLEINIRKNYLLNELLFGAGPVPWDDSLIEVSAINVDTTSLPLNIIEGGFASRNLFCDETQFLSGNMSVMTYDEYTREALKDVEVSYGCGIYEECYLGTTLLNHGTGYLSSKLPLCSNGYVLLEKTGYESKRIKISSIKDIPSNLGSVGLYPIITKNISIKLFPINYTYRLTSSDFDIPPYCFLSPYNFQIGFLMNSVSDDCYETLLPTLKISGYQISNQSRNLNSNESIMIKLTRISSGIDPKYEVIKTFNIGNLINQTLIDSGYIDEDYPFITTEPLTVDIIPGRYEIELTYFNNEGVVVPKDCDRACEDCAWYETCSVKHCKYYPSDPIELKPAPWGGLHFNSSYPVYFRPTDIYADDNYLEFYSITYPIPNDLSCLDSLDELNKKADYTLEYRTQLLPEFKTINQTISI